MRIIVITSVTAVCLLFAAAAWGHTPLFSCYDNGDDTVTCEGGFSDGSSAAGVSIHIKDGSGAVLMETKLDEFSEVTFDKPDGKYMIRFDAGEGHTLDVSGDTIIE